MDNPKPQAELAMLKQYGPDVPDATLQKLVAAFGALRSMADQGTITYPYSTREVVNIVKHLQVRGHRTCTLTNGRLRFSVSDCFPSMIHKDFVTLILHRQRC